MRIALILPYFGEFPNYFQLFLNSCGKNADSFDWLIFSDNQRPYDYPSNVKITIMTFEEMKRLVQSKFDFKIALNRPYKLCDFRPAYGYIFSDYLGGYDMWGHCDCDVIWGKLDNFLSKKILQYDKAGRTGHLTMYRNTSEINSAFMRDYKGNAIYKEVFASDKSFLFDEDNYNGNPCISDIWRNYGFSEYRFDDVIANADYKKNYFRLVFQVGEGYSYTKETGKKNLFIWEDGILKRYYMDGKELKCREFMYIHMMRRKMRIDKIHDFSKIMIRSNCFSDINPRLKDADSLSRIRCMTLNNQFFRTRYNNLLNKLRQRLKNE